MSFLLFLAFGGCSHECPEGFAVRDDGNCYYNNETGTPQNDTAGSDSDSNGGDTDDSSQDTDTDSGSTYDAPVIAIGESETLGGIAKNVGSLMSEGVAVEGSGPDWLDCPAALGPCIAAGETLLYVSQDGGSVAFGREEDGSWVARDRAKFYEPAEGQEAVGGYIDAAFTATEDGPIAVAYVVPASWDGNGDPASIEGPHSIYMSEAAGDGSSFRDWFWIAEGENVSDPVILMDPNGQGCTLYVSLGDTVGRAESTNCRKFSAIERLATDGGVPDATFDEDGNVVLMTNKDGWLRVAVSTDGSAGRTFGPSTLLVQDVSGGTIVREANGAWRVAMQNDGNHQ